MKNKFIFNFPGRLPFIRANKFVVAEMDPIVAFVNTKVSYQNIKNYLQISKYEKVAKTLFIVNLHICPFILTIFLKKCKNLTLCKSDIFIVWLITGNFTMQGITLTEHLDASQKADMRAYMSLVSNVLGNAEVFIFYYN